VKTHRTNLTLIEPLSIRVNFHPEDKTVTIVDLAAGEGFDGASSITLPAEYLVKTIAPAVESHLREIRNQPACPKDGGAP
jgi:hypothetical protein